MLVRFLAAGIACTACLVSVTQTARAQTPARLYELLGWQRNAREIELTDSQKRRIDDLKKRLNDRRSELNRAVESLRKDTRDRVLGILTRRQLQRLSQLHYQNRGTGALTETDTIKKLGLTNEQVEQIKKIRRESWGRNGQRKNVKEREKNVMAVLTPAQRTRWDKLQGPPRKQQQQQQQLNLPPGQQGQLWDFARNINPLTNGRYTKELNLTDRQKEKIRELTRQLWSNKELKEIRERYTDRYAATTNERRRKKIQQEYANAIKKFLEKRMDDVDSVLTRRQREQLERIRREASQERYRNRGPAALSSNDIALKLGLTEAQKKRMEALRAEARQAELDEERKSRDRVRQIKDDRDRRYLDILTPEQRAKWKKMLGRPRPDV